MAIPGQYIIPATPKREHQYRKIAGGEMDRIVDRGSSVRESCAGHHRRRAHKSTYQIHQGIVDKRHEVEKVLRTSKALGVKSRSKKLFSVEANSQLSLFEQPAVHREVSSMNAIVWMSAVVVKRRKKFLLFLSRYNARTIGECYLSATFPAVEKLFESWS